MPDRTPFEARAVTSRRGGPVKAPLSRDAVVGAALELLRREGLEGMSLRKVARALDTGPASLYVYLADLRELQALVLDRALAAVKVPARAGGWRQRLVALLESYFGVLHGTPGLAWLAMNAIATGPNALRTIDALLGLLAEAGVDAPSAAWAVDLLNLYVTAIAAEQTERRGDDDPLGPLARAIGAVTPAQHPHIHAVREHLLSGEGAERFVWAIDVLLKGVLGTPRPAAKRARRRPAGR